MKRIEIIVSEPLIGISTKLKQRDIEDQSLKLGYYDHYVRAVEQNGGKTVFIPTDLSFLQLNRLFQTFSGIILSGGGDIHPAHYGASLSDLTYRDDINHDRDKLEMNLVLRAIQAKKPLLGICRGLQMINTALGGSLYQDLTAEFDGTINHDQHRNEDGSDKPRDLLSHRVALSPGSLLAQVTGKCDLQVNSLHHQGIKNLASRLQPSGTVPEDGLIEGVELPQHPFFIGVQWHPEELQDLPYQVSIFHHFMEQCTQFARNN